MDNDLKEIYSKGLSEAEAKNRLKQEGYNELPQSQKLSILSTILRVLHEPMLALLLGGGIIYLLLGDIHEALLLLFFATISVFITVFQEWRTERVLEALRDLTSPRALVIREGKRQRIAGREIVRGDIIVLSEGDRIPADALLRFSHDLQIDESLLTGESASVRKTSTFALSSDVTARPGGDDLPFVFSGSLIVRGTGIAEVIAIGASSHIGKIGQSLAHLDMEPPRLHLQIQQLVWLFAVIGGVISLIVILLYGFFRGNWLEALLGGIALGMSMLPEEFPVVLTVFIAMGAWRISRVGVLTRRAASIETLGSATVLCTDKTGTLTENRMSIAMLYAKEKSGFALLPVNRVEISRPFLDLLYFGRLASDPAPFDPMEKAFHALDKENNIFRDTSSSMQLMRIYGLRPDLLAVTQAWKIDNHEESVIATKGAPETVMELCLLNPKERTEIIKAANDMANNGLRVLGVARATYDGPLPDDPRNFTFEFMGLVGLADPLRKNVPQSIADCQSAGIKVMMITGDYPITAKAIAQQAGFPSTNIMTGEDIAQCSDEELAKHVKHVSIFARVLPEQKLRIVQALKANGEITAMTGDGVNDAPSLKAAHIGIAMGGRGTDVAREAACIVLLDDDFNSIAKVIRLGRRIYDNIRKSVGFIFAVHIPIAGLALMPLLFGLPILIGPVHIALLEMVIDPICSLVFEAEEEENNIMQRPPRPPNASLFSKNLILWSLLQGISVLLAIIVIYAIGFYHNRSEIEIRTLSFFSLISMIIVLVFINRNFSASIKAALLRKNRIFQYVLLTILGVSVLILYWPLSRELFQFSPLHISDYAVMMAAAFIQFILLEAVKSLYRARL